MISGRMWSERKMADGDGGDGALGVWSPLTPLGLILENRAAFMEETVVFVRVWRKASLSVGSARRKRLHGISMCEKCGPSIQRYL